MAINPAQLSIRTLFEQNHTFEVPKYQRSYAWDDEAIDDFVDDIRRCLQAREAGTKPRSHFFGGVVAVRMPVPNSGRTNQEVIDGQQRLASFVMLVAAIVAAMRDIVGELEKLGSPTKEEEKAKEYLRSTIEALRGLYLIHKDAIKFEYVEVSKLKLSQADDAYFQATINGKQVTGTRASHERIAAAWKRLRSFISDYLKTSASAWESAQKLQHLIGGVLGEDCNVVFMPSDSRAEAYQIFQVLNDRGVHLTDGDLLRARTLERLDTSSLLTIQNAVADQWDKVLSFAPADTDSYLRWYFASHQGARPKSSNLADQFLESRFQCKDDKVVDVAGASIIQKEVQQLEVEFQHLDVMCRGDWPYDELGKIHAWDRERLRMLVIHLKHTNAMPLLLSLRSLDAQKFADVVAVLERFVFRYKTIGNAHIGPMTDLYLKYAKEIRDTNDCVVKTLRLDLTTLVEKVVPNAVFEANLRAIKYAAQGGNTAVRYLLIALEDYRKWFEDGASGMPRCKDKTQLFDFGNTSIEHVYPRSAMDGAKDAALEPLKETLGNLTILGPAENDKVMNKIFAEKRLVFKDSNIRLNRDIAENATWTAQVVNKRTDDLVGMAVKIFIP